VLVAGATFAGYAVAWTRFSLSHQDDTSRHQAGDFESRIGDYMMRVYEGVRPLRPTPIVVCISEVLGATSGCATSRRRFAKAGYYAVDRSCSSARGHGSFEYSGHHEDRLAVRASSCSATSQPRGRGRSGRGAGRRAGVTGCAGAVDGLPGRGTIQT